MKRLLTDFNTPRWEGVDMETARNSFEDIKKKMEDSGPIFGELNHPDDFEIHLLNVSHCVKNVEMVDDKIYGDVEILETPKGKEAKILFESGIVRMGMRASGRTQPKTFAVVGGMPEGYNVHGRVVSDIDPYGEENWDDDAYQPIKEEVEIKINKIFTWDIIPNE